ncbi:hypothetical protein [Pararhodobacter sp.]|uniref:hypothetical protein n=1 Tax=Pararhodobacter sp. TaxID=2127056 RepID=UPI002AFDE937|nr:hypothetical protein [Pararhodobacter sp.]
MPPAPRLAGPLTEAASAIELLIAQGQTREAVDAARDFMRAVTDLSGFGVTNAQLIASPATGFGIFEPRASNVYRIGDPVYAYVEVYGFSLTPQPSGVNQMRFDVAFTLDSPDGRQMTPELIPMGDIQLESYREPVDGYFHLTYRVTGAVGAFTLRTSVTDRESGQRAEFTLPVVFEDAPSGLAPSVEK